MFGQRAAGRHRPVAPRCRPHGEAGIPEREADVPVDLGDAGRRTSTLVLAAGAEAAAGTALCLLQTAVELEEEVRCRFS